MQPSNELIQTNSQGPVQVLEGPAAPNNWEIGKLKAMIGKNWKNLRKIGKLTKMHSFAYILQCF